MNPQENAKPSPNLTTRRGLRWDTTAVIFLLALGLLHIPIQLLSDAPWGDPISYRKPILFGISTGLTLGSLLLLMNELRPRYSDPWIRSLLCISLVIEVLLITLQAWRKVPSHFNHSTIQNAAIELGMLICVLLAVGIILGLTVRTFQSNSFLKAVPERIVAQRFGMLFLMISCGIGIGITLIGYYLLLNGQSPELLGKSGVLKFPHGATLHAIQILVLWSWVCAVFGSSHGPASVAWLATAHLWFLIYSLRQTLLGMNRWEIDDTGFILIACTILSVIISSTIAIWPAKNMHRSKQDKS